jgi:hypothetical protein
MEKERRLRMKMEAAAAKKERAKNKNKRRQHPAPTDVRSPAAHAWEPPSWSNQHPPPSLAHSPAPATSCLTQEKTIASAAGVDTSLSQSAPPATQVKKRSLPALPSISVRRHTPRVRGRLTYPPLRPLNPAALAQSPGDAVLRGQLHAGRGQPHAGRVRGRHAAGP